MAGEKSPFHSLPRKKAKKKRTLVQSPVWFQHPSHTIAVMRPRSSNGVGWQAYESGASMGSVGSENGVIILDEWHPADVRITLERDGITAPFAITCGLAGWFVHSAFFSEDGEARDAFKSMKAALEQIILLVPSATNSTREEMNAVTDAIKDFVKRFQ